MKKSIFKRIGLIALAVCVAIGSFFIPLKSDKKLSYASSDTVSSFSSFIGSNVIVPVNAYNHSTSDVTRKSGLYFLSFAVSFYSFNSSLYLDVKNSLVSKLETDRFNFVSCYTNSSNSSTTLTIPIEQNSPYFDLHLYTPSSRFNVIVSFSSSDFTSNIYKAVIGTSVDNYGTSSNPNYLCSYYVRYYDNNDNYVNFSIDGYYRGSTVTNKSELFILEDRTYFINNQFSDSQIYQQGYSQGLADNQSNIYNNGYNAGYNVGYGNGVNVGRVEANDYSFISLIGAVVDVPVQTIRGMLNFTFLGINLFDFLMGLIAILVILFIVKLVRGG